MPEIALKNNIKDYSSLIQSHYYINLVASNFYGTEIEIWDGFGPVGSNEKKIWAEYKQLLRAVFLCFHGQKIFVASTLKSCMISLL